MHATHGFFIFGVLVQNAQNFANFFEKNWKNWSFSCPESARTSPGTNFGGQQTKGSWSVDELYDGLLKTLEKSSKCSSGNNPIQPCPGVYVVTFAHCNFDPQGVVKWFRVWANRLLSVKGTRKFFWLLFQKNINADSLSVVFFWKQWHWNCPPCAFLLFGRVKSQIFWKCVQPSSYFLFFRSVATMTQGEAMAGTPGYKALQKEVWFEQRRHLHMPRTTTPPLRPPCTNRLYSEWGLGDCHEGLTTPTGLSHGGRKWLWQMGHPVFFNGYWPFFI